MIAFRNGASFKRMNYSKTICDVYDVQVLKGFTVFAIYTAGDAVKILVCPRRRKAK